MKKDKHIIHRILFIFALTIFYLTYGLDKDIKLKNNDDDKSLKISSYALASPNTKDEEYIEVVSNALIEKPSDVIVADTTVKQEDIKESITFSEVARPYGNNGVAEGAYVWPTQGGYYITSNYGYRVHPTTGSYSFHRAIDISGPGAWSQIYAVNNGVVYSRSWSRSYGNYMIINHNNGYYTLYAHMNGFGNFYPGSTVEKGAVIGYMGSTGNSTGPHLHFELWNGVPWNGGYSLSPWTLY